MFKGIFNKIMGRMVTVKKKMKLKKKKISAHKKKRPARRMKAKKAKKIMKAKKIKAARTVKRVKKVKIIKKTKASKKPKKSLISGKPIKKIEAAIKESKTEEYEKAKAVILASRSSGAAGKAESKVKGTKKDHIVYLGLGSNVGDREEYIEQAVFLLSKSPKIKVTKRSTNYESEAEGSSNQPPFLNAAIEIKTSLDPHQLLELIQETENACGRERDVEWGPRTMDIDILFYDNDIISEDKLQIPHPLIHERLFALIPLAEIAPRKEHPVLEKTIEQLMDEKKTEVGEKYDDELPGFKEIRKGVADDYERW